MQSITRTAGNLLENPTIAGSGLALLGLVGLFAAPVMARLQARLTAGGEVLVRAYTVLIRVIGATMIVSGVFWVLGWS